MKDNRGWNLRVIAEAGLMLALAWVLGQLKLFSAPYGGSVTAGSMIPLLLMALLRGPKVGILVGIVYGFLNYLTGGWFVSPVQWALDYPVAFGVLGVAGVVALPGPRSRLGRLMPFVGALVGLGLRFVSHFLAGIWFWGQYAPEGMPVWLYSLTYNAGYLVPEFVISGVFLSVLLPALNKYLRQRA